MDPVRQRGAQVHRAALRRYGGQGRDAPVAAPPSVERAARLRDADRLELAATSQRWAARPSQRALTRRFWHSASRVGQSSGSDARERRVVKVDLDMAWQQFRRLPTTAREATVLLR